MIARPYRSRGRLAGIDDLSEDVDAVLAAHRRMNARDELALCHRLVAADVSKVRAAIFAHLDLGLVSDKELRPSVNRFAGKHALGDDGLELLPVLHRADLSGKPVDGLVDDAVFNALVGEKL